MRAGQAHCSSPGGSPSQNRAKRHLVHHRGGPGCGSRIGSARSFRSWLNAERAMPSAYRWQHRFAGRAALPRGGLRQAQQFGDLERTFHLRVFREVFARIIREVIGANRGIASAEQKPPCSFADPER